ncbi:MAG: polysaccharide biosynthesis protein PslG, partial [Solirubrobacteraceae bacterium]|nr:polysaccharide biosynthesis protein PslG [Solirubrobacteraceae bacterium]
IRVSVFWRLSAPDPLAKTRPAKFDAADPAAYPDGSWARYDQVVTDAQALGVAVNLDITSPGPLWATGTPDRADIAATYKPSAGEFGQFVHAVGTRYSGTYSIPGPAPPPVPAPAPPPVQPPNLLQLLLGINPNGSGSNPAPVPPAPLPPATVLPRVGSWSIWNEPNQAGWLTPQWAPDAKGRLVETSPALYRSLVDASYAQLLQTGHASDTILIGETAPKGVNAQGETRAIKPLRFIRDLYCLDTGNHALRGSAAARLGCPTTARLSAAFPATHPALFRATGWAHHPYELTFGPNVRLADPDYITIANLGRLGSVLDAGQRAYHRSRRLPFYLTEFGYMTNPPSDAGVTLTQQAAYLNQAEYIAYSNSRVRDLSQFLLVDSPLIPCVHCSKPGSFGSSFETGLEFGGGRPKPSFAAYRIPIFLPQPAVRRGGSLRVWGMVRPALNGASQRVSIEFRPGSSGAFKRLALARTRSHPAYLDTRVRLPRSGQLRLSWRAPSGAVLRSRNVNAVAR